MGEKGGKTRKGGQGEFKGNGIDAKRKGAINAKSEEEIIKEFCRRTAEGTAGEREETARGASGEKIIPSSDDSEKNWKKGKKKKEGGCSLEPPNVGNLVVKVMRQSLRKRRVSALRYSEVWLLREGREKEEWVGQSILGFKGRTRKLCILGGN